MTDELDIHPASESERRAAFRNVFDVWPMAADIDEHVALRRASPAHARARWFVGTRGGRVVTALGCHSLVFRLLGERAPGIAICSVHTIAEARGRGFAERLVRRVEEVMAERGARLALLYSDIDPDYYERLGYRLCPAWEGWTATAFAPHDVPNEPHVVPFAPLPSLGELAEMHAAFHAADAISIDRDEEYWRHLLDRGPTDSFLWIVDRTGRRLGFLRVRESKDRVTLRDFALADHSEAAHRALAGALSALAKDGRVAGGWMPDRPAFRARFALRPRRMEITMLKPLDPALRPSRDMLAAADSFHEIDHV